MKKRSHLVLLSMVLLVGIFYSGTPIQAKTTEKQYKQQIENLKKQVKAKDKEIKSLKTKVSDRDKKIKTKDSQIKSKDSSMKSKDKDIAAKKKQIADRDKTIVAKNKEITTLKGKAFTTISSQLVYQDKSKTGNIKIGSSTVPSLVTYKGVYYSPVNALASMMNLGVKYDTKQKKLFVGEGTDGVMMSDIIKPYNGPSVDINEDFTMGSIKYKKGYQYDISYTSTSKINLQSKYSSITGLVGLDDNNYSYDTKVEFYGDGKMLTAINLKSGDLPKPLSLNVKNVKVLDIKLIPVYAADWERSIDLVNLKIK